MTVGPEQIERRLGNVRAGQFAVILRPRGDGVHPQQVAEVAAGSRRRILAEERAG